MIRREERREARRISERKREGDRSGGVSEREIRGSEEAARDDQRGIVKGRSTGVSWKLST